MRENGTASIVNSRFMLLTTFQFTVPDDYDHTTQLASFAKKNRKKFYFYNKNITDANFSKATNKLTPGKVYEVKTFKITERVTSRNCLAFLKTQKAILVGAQGISAVWQQAKEQFFKGKWTVSFDEKSVLWRSTDGYHQVPYIDRNSDGNWNFDLGYFGYIWDEDECLFCVCDLSS